MKKCSCCILPETMPFIEFDNDGVCNYCHSYKKMTFKPLEELFSIADRIRKTDGSPDCIVMFSGGRDSSYLLHYVVKELKLHPIAFTYDWGMSTPIGSANAQRMCDQLQVERVIVDKDAEKKLNNVRKNVNAWCKKPELGMVPLFMAGDKQFFLEVNKLAKERNINTIFIGTNPLEKTDFKTGFCGVSPNFGANRIYSLTLTKKLRLIGYYLWQFIRNPAYINSSLFDTAKAFFSFYGAKQEEVDIYKYIKWDEKIITDLLINQYGWERDPECQTTWRIGDGTAAFYNYIYYSTVGFTENDTLRSNQIREGAISRENALEMVKNDNIPRFQSMDWYFKRIGVDKEKVLAAVNRLTKTEK